MASESSVFDMDNFTVTRTPVPNAGGDSSVPAINQGAGSGSRITSVNFLTTPKLLPGQDQVLVHSGDQSVLLDQDRHQWIKQTEYTTIGKQRQTEVREDELYVNQQKYEHRVVETFTQNVWGDFYETHYATTTGVYKDEYKVDYYGALNSGEHYTQTRHRNLSETIIQTGSSWIAQAGQRGVAQWGANYQAMSPFRATAIGGLELKIASLADLAFTPIKNSTSLADSKINFFNLQTGKAKLDAKAVDITARAALIRIGALCLKGAAACIGTIRW